MDNKKWVHDPTRTTPLEVSNNFIGDKLEDVWQNIASLNRQIEKLEGKLYSVINPLRGGIFAVTEKHHCYHSPLADDITTLNDQLHIMICKLRTIYTQVEL